MGDEEIPIRLATPGDLEQIVRCVNAAYAQYLDRMDRPPAPLLVDYAALIARGVVYALVSPHGVCGLLVMEMRAESLFIENVAVDPTYQGQGLGRRLMAFAEQYAREHRLRELRLYTNERMVESLAFYRSLGFEEVERRLDDGYQRVFLREQLDG
jgi:ribosomal protein S18 acetylase RimI-like enzyme